MREFYPIAIPLIAGFILDLILGDPLYLPHPIRWFGKAISFFEQKLNRGKNIRLKGFLMALMLIGITYIAFYGILKLSLLDRKIYYPLATILVFYGLASRSLISEALKVERKLAKEGLKTGRKQLSYIVGRDTSQLSENKIRIAVLETLSENLSDGVIAPLFYYAIGGIPLMFAYKMVNTLDSMIGYKNERYKHFGFFAAKLDDVANFIPARITAILMVLITFSWRGMKYIFLFGNKHSSPNAGYPEAALAGILNCRFGGPNYYKGKLVEKPFIGNRDKTLSYKHLAIACSVNILVSILFLFLIMLLNY